MSKYAIDSEIMSDDDKEYVSRDNMILARASIVNEYGVTVLDDYVKPHASLTRYKTCVTEIKRNNMENGLEFSVVHGKVQSMINGCILIGYSLDLVLDALCLSHPKQNQRDLENYEPFRRYYGGQPSLQFLTRQYLGINMHEGEHDSVDRAKFCMNIYHKVASQWESLY